MAEATFPLCAVVLDVGADDGALAALLAPDGATEGGHLGGVSAPRALAIKKLPHLKDIIRAKWTMSFNNRALT